MKLLQSLKLDSNAERLLITGLSVSDRVCRELLPLINEYHFQQSYVRKIIGWVKAYFSSYKEAPRKHLQDLFEAARNADSKRERITSEEATLIAEFLSKLSRDYQEGSSFNEEYVISQGKKLLNRLRISYISERLQSSVESNRFGDAEKIIIEYNQFAKETSEWIDPFDPKEIAAVMTEQKEHLLKLQGKLGSLIGPLERGWLVGILGPVKRGKTWWLMALALQALLLRLKVVFFSLEMGQVQMEQRLYKMITSAKEDESGDLIYPTFDCELNQSGTCKLSKRKNKMRLPPESKFDPSMKYRPCSYCREKIPENYAPAVWYVLIKRPKMTYRIVKRAVRAFSLTYGKNLRLRSYPRFSANIAQISSTIDYLIATEGFIPDVIVIDYADILAHEAERDDMRSMIDETWMTLARMAEERKALVLTGSQSTRKSWEARDVRAVDVSEDYRKIAHCDVMISINQTQDEKKRGIVRMGVVAHRYADFLEYNQVTVLQQLKAGQPLLDVEVIEEKPSERREEKREKKS